MHHDHEYKDEQLSEMGLLDHLGDLRTCLFKAIIAICILFPIGIIFSKPLIGQLTSMTTVPTLQAIMPAETFMEQIKVGLIIAAFLVIPYLTYLAWQFVSPALYDKEKSWGKNIVISSTFLFLIGAMFAYFFILPATLDFFYSQNIPGVEYKPRLASITSFALQICGATGLMAQLPVITVILYSLEIVSLEKLKNSRSVVFISILVVSALLTPPDVFSQCMIGIPAYLIFEVSLFLCSIMESKKEGKSIRQKLTQGIIALVILLIIGAYMSIWGVDQLKAYQANKKQTIEQKSVLTEDWQSLDKNQRAQLIKNNYQFSLSPDNGISLNIQNIKNLPVKLEAQLAFELDGKTYLYPNKDFIYRYTYAKDRALDNLSLHNLSATLEILKDPQTLAKVHAKLLILKLEDLDNNTFSSINQIKNSETYQ